MRGEAGVRADQDNEDDEESPAKAFSIFSLSQDLYEKLSLLQYSSDFSREYKCKPIHR